MKLTFLGTGDFLPEESGHNSAFIEWGDNNLFIDFPSTNRKALLKLNQDLNIVKNLFITHLHEDHINGIQQLAHYRVISGKEKVRLYIAENLLEGLWSSVKEGLSKSTNGEKSLQDYFEVITLKEDESFYIEDNKIQLIRTNHIPDMVSYGLLVEPFFYYSGDSNVDSKLLNNILVETIFHDCHLWDFPIASHASLEDIKKLDLKIKEKMVLMHYHSGYDSEGLKKVFEKRENIKIARPLVSYNFSDIDQEVKK